MRQAAVYGLGVVAKFSESNYFVQVKQSIVNVLVAAIAIPEGANHKTHGHARDNAIASLGKCIKYQNCTDLLETWLQVLPLKFDKEEAREQHELLTDLIISNSQCIFGATN